MQKLIFLKWLPASGKSTWAKDFCKKQKAKRVNKDEIRSMVDNGIFSKENEKLVNEIQRAIVIKALSNGYSVVVDNTHLSGTHEDDYRTLVEDYNTSEWKPTVTFEIKEFHTPLETCIERDEARPNPVGASVIHNMAMKSWWWKAPAEFTRVTMDTTLPDAFIFDIDGTLAFMNGRSPYDYSKVLTDGVHDDVARILFDMHILWRKIILCSGRSEDCRADTEAWLSKNSIHYDSLHMRKSWDIRKDSQVKYEILLDLIKENYIMGVFDDRDQVVKMWREAWLRCYQVNYGNF